MGNYKFRLSDMMPNTWFYKLKDMSRATTTTKHRSKRLLNNPKPAPTTKNQRSNPFPQQDQLYIPNRPSYYISSSTSPAHPKDSDTLFPLDPPTKSKKPHRRNNSNSNNNDIVIDLTSLPPINTKPAKKKETEQVMLRRARQGLHRIKVRPSSPRIEIKRSGRGGSSRRLAESFVIVKKSADPGRDFKESMVEMIVENDIRGSKDLEELLACYLSLNSDEYHDLIVKVFEEIWIHLTVVRDCL